MTESPWAPEDVEIVMLAIGDNRYDSGTIQQAINVLEALAFAGRLAPSKMDMPQRTPEDRQARSTEQRVRFIVAGAMEKLRQEYSMIELRDIQRAINAMNASIADIAAGRLLPNSPEIFDELAAAALLPLEEEPRDS